ncbi:putative inorganic phosphate cotransporter [Ornithodoros turicata]|uniref:putative inorganic phosphate cotransporter n=1 Tax=Ornithodoros turicata TaxID=34597 RepID=UPI003138A187
MSGRIAVRYVFALTGFLGLLHLYVQRLNMSVAIVAMVRMVHSRNATLNTGCDDIQHSNLSTVELDGEFDWDENTQSLVLASFFYGYILLQFPGGRLADRFGGKYLMGGGIFVSSVLTILTPTAARLHFGVLMALRFLMGLAVGCCYPAMQAMLAQWVPNAERTIISNIVFTGSFVGTLLAMTATGVMSDSKFLGGWPSTFYVFGLTGCIWSTMWFSLISNHPHDHPTISASELFLITDGKEIVQHNSAKTIIPWKAILTSPAVWSLAATQWAHTYGAYTLMTELPNYLKNILGFGLTENGLLSGVPYLMLSFVSLFVAWLADILRRRRLLGLTSVRKLCDCVSSFGPALCLLAVTVKPCERLFTVAFLWMAILLIAFGNSGFNCTHVDMAPAFAGTLFGLTNCISNTTGILAPQVVGYLTEHNNNVNNWKTVFYITSCVYITGGLAFLAFGSAEVQHWAVVEGPPAPQPAQDCDAQRVPEVEDVSTAKDFNATLEHPEPPVQYGSVNALAPK